MTDLHKIKLTHYSSTDKLVVSTMEQSSEAHMKPQGLWVSVDGEHDWREWCTSEKFRLEHYTHKYRIKLVKDTNVLLIDTEKKLREFSKKYKTDQSILPRSVLASIYLRWDAVAQFYGGIIIAPYQWQAREDMDMNWYYSWDCASGCIWDLRCIREVQYAGECNFERDTKVTQ